MLHVSHTCKKGWDFYFSAVTIVLMLLTSFPFPLLPLQSPWIQSSFRRLQNPCLKTAQLTGCKHGARTKQNNQDNSLLIPHLFSMPINLSDGLFLNPGLVDEGLKGEQLYISTQHTLLVPATFSPETF